MKSSHSQNQLYSMCPKAWDIQYNEGLQSETEGSSLYFGTAIDAAISELLNGNVDYEQKFKDRWEFQYKNGNAVKIFDNDRITYGHKDFDHELLKPEDTQDLEKWARELNLIEPSTSANKEILVELFKICSKAKSNPYIRITPEQFKYFNRCSWLGLKRKGELLIKAFKEQFYPKIKKVIAVQKRSKIEDPSTGDSLVGFIDMILEIEGYDKPVIFDLKTSGMPYEQHDISVSPQLTLYAAMEAKNYNTDLVGYAVLCKNIAKDTVNTCVSCGNIKSGRHKTCEQTDSSGNRCNGNWLESKIPKPEVQVMVEKKTPEQINDLLADASNIILAMKNRIVYKNTTRCTNWYGGICSYYNYCHKGDATGLVKK